MSSKLDPVFKRQADGSLTIGYTNAAFALTKCRGKTQQPAQQYDTVYKSAELSVLRLGGSVNQQRHVLGQLKMQFGKFQGMTFCWLLENALGYAAFICHDIRREAQSTAPISVNKFKLKEYLLMFPEGREALDMKAAESEKKLPKKNPVSIQTQKTPTPSTSYTTPMTEMDDAALLDAVHEIESVSSASQLEPPLNREKPHTITAALTYKEEHPMLEGWKSSIPDVDQAWISKAIFTYNQQGKPALNDSKINRLWFHPPQPALSVTQVPRLEKYFGHRLLLWMPRRLWRVKLYCPKSTCFKKGLTSAGVHKTVRKVVDVQDYYLVATETLECRSCKGKVAGWSGVILRQLDVGHRLQFPVLLTYRFACDISVVRFLRQRSLGNGATQLQKQLIEQHGEAYISQVTSYLTQCKGVLSAVKSGLTQPPTINHPPEQIPVPKFRWFLKVYCVDVMQRVDEVKAAITSTFGRVLKLDSTKKVVKKLAGHSHGTATWATDIGNEHGQVLNCVLTTTEGFGLEPLAEGLINRYKTAKVEPPVLMYVDRGCCNDSQLKRMFGAWPEMTIRLDIWHFMRRIASCCTTEAHQLYGIFMGRLARCIYEVCAEDLQTLIEAKRSQLLLHHLENLSNTDVLEHISKKELSKHCRRRTRGVEETEMMITDLLAAFTGPEGLDTLGTPLLQNDKVWAEWESQKKHVPCIQDPEGIPLYTETGSVLKGNISVPTYRCSRGSTSLESFHLHLNRFIPGTSASDMHFQAYLLDGLVRWNADRENAARKVSSEVGRSYSGLLRTACNDLSKEILGENLVKNYIAPMKYTGESIGVEYLYNQTGQVLQDLSTIDPDGEHAAALEAVDDTVVEEEEGEEEGDEGFEEIDDLVDFTIPYVGVIETVKAPSSNIARASVTNPTPLPSPSEEPTQSSEHEETVGPDNVAGFEKVDALAAYLFNLREQTTPLNNATAENIIKLWNDLTPFDKQPAKLSQRSRSKQLQGRFKSSKGSSVVPGLESTKRSFLGLGSGPAQWPDANRYMEAVLDKLCVEHPAPVRQEGKVILRFTLVSRAYRNIRDRVVANARIMAHTNIQLLEVNNTTLSQWFIKKEKAKDQKMLEQGMLTPAPALASKQPSTFLQPIQTPVVSVVPQEQRHVFLLPKDTAGQAMLGRKGTLQPVLPQAHFSKVDTIVTSPHSKEPENLPRSTLCYRRQREREELTSIVPTKRYKREVSSMKCKKCNKERTGTHKQYYGSWFCPTTSIITFDEWLKNIKASREIKKKSH